jgi:DNA-binding response OmpR family regulator
MCDDLTDLRDLLRGCQSAPRYQFRVLYVGQNHALFQFLKAALQERDCGLIYCPASWLARILLESDVYYALWLFDDLPDATGAELAQFARSLSHRAHTPAVVISDPKA